MQMPCPIYSRTTYSQKALAVELHQCAIIQLDRRVKDATQQGQVAPQFGQHVCQITLLSYVRLPDAHLYATSLQTGDGSLGAFARSTPPEQDKVTRSLLH